MMRLIHLLLAPLVALVLISVPGTALAQFSSDSSAPTSFGADESEIIGSVFTLTGQVDIRQGDVRLLADKVEIFRAEGQGGGLVSTDGITRMVATGNFYYITPEQEVRGEKGVYTRATDRFVVTGDVVLLQDDSVVVGERLDYDLTTRDAKVVGECKGRACPRDQRVAILINSSAAQGN